MVISLTEEDLESLLVEELGLETSHRCGRSSSTVSKARSPSMGHRRASQWRPRPTVKRAGVRHAMRHNATSLATRTLGGKRDPRSDSGLDTRRHPRPDWTRCGRHRRQRWPRSGDNARPGPCWRAGRHGGPQPRQGRRGTAGHPERYSRRITRDRQPRPQLVGISRTGCPPRSWTATRRSICSSTTPA